MNTIEINGKTKESIYHNTLIVSIMMYVIGNSHIGMFNSDSRFTVVDGNVSSAAATAHNLNKKNSTSQSNRILFNLANRIDKENDSIILVYGEIDCRVHIYYQFKKNNEKYTITELIDKTIHNYGSVMQELKNMGIKFYICGIPPVDWKENPNIINLYKWQTTPDIHYKIYREFNNKLNLFCKKNGYKYLDIYSKTIDNNGFRKKEYDEDGIHLNKNALPFIVDILKEYGI